MMRARRSWSLRRRVIALCVTVGLVLTGLAVAEAVVAAKNRDVIESILNRSGPLRVQAEALLAALVNQETGVRGYVVTGVRDELGPYEAGLKQERETVAAMTPLLTGYPAAREQLATVERQADRWRQSVAVPAIEATNRNGKAAGQALLTEQARLEFDDLRESIRGLQQSILEIRQQGAVAANRTSNTLVILLIGATVVVLLAGSALVMSLNRVVIGPLTALAAQVRDVAAGDYQREIQRIGPPELAQLAGDVDAMRRKIAADLAEVRTARANIEAVNSQLEKQAEELVRSNRDLEQFAYVASHDLQEPLRKVASFCQLLQRRYAGQLDERADQYIAFAVDGAQRMQRLINDLLAFSRIGRLTTGFIDVDLNRVMGDVAGQTEAARQYADGELTWSDLPVVHGEEALLANLLANLVSNSLKFRRPDLPPRVRVSARRVGEEWEISCQDNGIGIEAEFADKIFVIFQRLHAKDAYPGTGIGLAIVKKIVEYHGGRVWVDPEVTEGTAIRFTLPVVVGPDDQTSEESDGQASEESDDQASEALTRQDGAPDDAATVGPADEHEPGGAIAAVERSGGGGKADSDSGGKTAEETGGMRETVA